MAVQPRRLTPDRSARDLFGAELRRLREEAGLSLARLADILKYSKTHLGNIETADRGVPPDLPPKLDVLFEAGEHFQRLYGLAKKEVHPGKYRRYMELEAQAVDIRHYAGHMVPGLLQTKAYAEVLLRAGDPEAADEAIEELVAARLSRQERLRSPAPPQLSVVLDEAVMRRPVGGLAVMREQFDVLLALVDTPRTMIQVLPFTHGVHGLMGGSQDLLLLQDGTRIAYSEGSKSGLVIEDPADVEWRWQAYDRLRAYALSPRESAALIRSAMED